MTFAERDSMADVVRAFYAAVAARDALTIEHVVAEAFDPDIVLQLPSSLPYGGEHSGARRLSRMFTSMAAATTPVGPTELVLTDLIEDGNKIVASLAFTYVAPRSDASLPMTALEVWTFREKRVRQIRAYYWDTAVCVAASPNWENT